MKASIGNFADVRKAVAFARKFHERSSWRFLAFNRQYAERNLVHMIRDPASDLLLVKDEGQITALMLAGVDTMMMNKVIYGHDIHFVADKGGPMLFRFFEEWAKERNAKLVLMQIANQDPDGRTAKFYQAMGMQPIGSVWVKSIHPQFSIGDIDAKVA